MLGEYSQDMHDAPYILEGLVENWEDEHSAEVIIKSSFSVPALYTHTVLYIYIYISPIIMFQ